DRRVISEIVHVLKSGCRWSGLVTGYGNRWTRKRVTSLRSHRRIPVYKSGEDRIEPWLNLSKAARFLRVAPKTLRLAAEDEQIWAIHSRMTRGSSAALFSAHHRRVLSPSARDKLSPL